MVLIVKRTIKMKDRYDIFPVGVIKKDSETVRIEIFEEYRDALLRLDDFSHITVCYWFHENDTLKKRKTLQVHPRKNKKNPLSGVFATHSPLRPNLIAISICKILSIKDTTIFIEKIDAFDGSPVIDIKCFIPSRTLTSDIKLPDWV
jgi:tRNA-Thr(GGU) m(6)t(6)A37 methyltransferase TsaA